MGFLFFFPVVVSCSSECKILLDVGLNVGVNIGVEHVGYCCGCDWKIVGGGGVDVSGCLIVEGCVVLNRFDNAIDCFEVVDKFHG